MSNSRCKVSREDLLAAFHTEETFKGFCARVGISPNTLRPLWVAEFGKEAFAERGRRLQVEAAIRTCKAIVPYKKYKRVDVVCSRCGVSESITLSRKNRRGDKPFVCSKCEELAQGDRRCPVCGLMVDGARGLSGHFRQARLRGDEAHAAYQEAQEASRWEGKVEGVDYVECRLCGHRSLSIGGHLGAAHGMKAPEYRAKYPGALVRASSVQGRITEGGLKSQQENGTGKGDQKLVRCPGCGLFVVVSKFLSEDVHDARCDACRARDEDALWEGLTEPEDYVTCRVCGYRAHSLSSHLQNAHPKMVGRYLKKYPGAFLTSLNCSVRVAVNKIGLTKADLEPHMDSKGRVEVGRAAEAFGCSWWTVLKYARELGLPTRNRLAFQKQVLDVVSDILGEPYVWEWTHPGIKNPVTGYPLYFDGRFEYHDLVVEAHGKQHYEYVEYWHKTEAEFRRRCALDALKARRLRELGIRLLVVRYDDPVDEASLRARLGGWV